VVQVLADQAIADMYGFCRALNLPCRMGPLASNDSNVKDNGTWNRVIWCFANPLHARTFHRNFGGEFKTVIEEF
jgi:hypothetical protein